MNKKFKHLLRLLDDDNEQSATFAMAELLDENDPRLERVLRLLQETPNQKLRRRIHQLQTAITKRCRRLFLASCLTNPEFSLLDTVISLHLMWFDNDTYGEVLEQWKEMLDEMESATKNPSGFRDFVPYLKKRFLLFENGSADLHADNLCFGIVLEENSAVDYLLCIIAKLIADEWNMPAEVVSSNGDFALFSEGDLFFPKQDWSDRKNTSSELKFWTTRELGNLLTAQLFTCAVATDSFRYIHTIGGMMRDTKQNVEMLPYPYGNAK